MTRWGGKPVPLATSSTGVTAKTAAANEHALLVSAYLKAHPKTAAAAGGLSIALLAVAL